MAIEPLARQKENAAETVVSQFSFERLDKAPSLRATFTEVVPAVQVGTEEREYNVYGMPLNRAAKGGAQYTVYIDASAPEARQRMMEMQLRMGFLWAKAVCAALGYEADEAAILQAVQGLMGTGFMFEGAIIEEIQHLERDRRMGQAPFVSVMGLNEED